MSKEKEFVFKLPSSIRVGGQLLNVEMTEELNGKLGVCGVAVGYIKISEMFQGKRQSESCKVNTFIHECVHCILDTMGRDDLSSDEVFVNTFASFATEILFSMKFDEHE